MSEWISVEDRKPETDQLCYVYNERWSVCGFIAMYHLRYDSFVLQNMTMYDIPALDVTHWVPLPYPTLIQEK